MLARRGWTRVPTVRCGRRSRTLKQRISDEVLGFERSGQQNKDIPAYRTSRERPIRRSAGPQEGAFPAADTLDPVRLIGQGDHTWQ